MSAYMIGNVRFRDPEKGQEYGRQIAATVEKYGGRYLARGGQVDVAEGDWQFYRAVLIEFPSLEQARRWYESDEYRPIRALRQEHADSQIIFIEGLTP